MCALFRRLAGIHISISHYTSTLPGHTNELTGGGPTTTGTVCSTVEPVQASEVLRVCPSPYRPSDSRPGWRRITLAARWRTRTSSPGHRGKAVVRRSQVRARGRAYIRPLATAGRAQAATVAGRQHSSVV